MKCSKCNKEIAEENFIIVENAYLCSDCISLYATIDNNTRGK